MSIPEFDEDGAFPPGDLFGVWDESPIFLGHACTYEEIRNRLVTHFPDSLTRPFLMHEFEQFVIVAHRFFNCFTVFLSGEFVINVESPRSIFIVLQALGADTDSLSGENRWLLSRLFEEREWELSADDDLRVMTDMTITYPESHSRHDESNVRAMATRLQASTPTPEFEDRGYLEIIDCEEGVLSAIEVFENS